MEKVEDLMKSLKLSEMENKGLRIGWSDGKKAGAVEPQAIGKLLSEKPAHAEAMATTLGRIWCPMRGATCRDMGDNIFVFTFRQDSGKNKALLDGPWMFNKSLLMLEDFVPSKTLSEYDFSTTPIWIRMFGLPLGMMDRDTGEYIGDDIGEFMDADVGEDGLAEGKYLRVKVRITKYMKDGRNRSLRNAHLIELIHCRSLQCSTVPTWAPLGSHIFSSLVASNQSSAKIGDVFSLLPPNHCPLAPSLGGRRLALPRPVSTSPCPVSTSTATAPPPLPCPIPFPEVSTSTGPPPLLYPTPFPGSSGLDLPRVRAPCGRAIGHAGTMNYPQHGEPDRRPRCLGRERRTSSSSSAPSDAPRRRSRLHARVPAWLAALVLDGGAVV